MEKKDLVSCREITSAANASFIECVQVVQLLGYQRGVVARGGAAPRHVCHQVCGGVGGEGGAGEEAVAVRDRGPQTHTHA